MRPSARRARGAGAPVRRGALLALALVVGLGRLAGPGLGTPAAWAQQPPPTPGWAGFALPGAARIDGPPAPVPPAVVTRDTDGHVTMRALHLDAPLRVDGQLDETIYRTVPPVTDFVQQEPDEGRPAVDRTEVWVLFDADTLYVAARCWSTEPSRIVANEMKRDGQGMFGNETFAVVIDTFYDRRNGYNFVTNALGGLMDGTITNEGNANRDWNTVWDVRTSRFDEGWTLEMAIPFKSLRYGSAPSPVWGVNFQRRVASTNETSFLSPIPASLAFAGLFKLSSAANLVGLELPSSGPRLEIKPYAIADLSTNLAAAPPFRNHPSADAGIDLKLGVTQGLTADLTYNTDFAQVEVDEQQVNLTRFSLFFPEKREFFLEGGGIFEFGGQFRSGPTQFFFRGERFGGEAPVLFFSRRIGLDDGRTVPILGGGRLTGKAGPYSVGLIDVQTDRVAGTDIRSTNFSVARIKRDVLRRSAVGGMFTGRSEAVAGGGANLAYGVDGVFAFYDNLNINTYLARTETPDRRGDDTSYQAQLDYNGDRWGLKLDRLQVGEHFNPEIGFLRRDDFRRSFAEFRFSPRPAAIAAVRKLLWQASLDHIENTTGRLETRLRQGIFGIEFENGDRFYGGATDSYEFLEQPFDIASDVSIPAGAYHFINTRAVYAFGQQRVVSGAITLDRGSFFGGRRTSVGYFNGRVNLSERMTVEPGVSINWIDLPFGTFTTGLVTTRATYTLTPRTFVAALVQYNSANASLGTNIRLRWEYQPGSELFVVYTDERDTLTPRFPVLKNRALVVKLTRLFRY